MFTLPLISWYCLRLCSKKFSKVVFNKCCRRLLILIPKKKKTGLYVRSLSCIFFLYQQDNANIQQTIHKQWFLYIFYSLMDKEVHAVVINATVYQNQNRNEVRDELLVKCITRQVIINRRARRTCVHTGWRGKRAFTFLAEI